MTPTISKLNKRVYNLQRSNRQLRQSVQRLSKTDQSRHFGTAHGSYSREDAFQPSTAEDFLQLYEQYIHVFACVDAIARNMARLAFRIYKLKSLGGDKDRRGDEITDGDWWSLFNRPNKFMSGYGLIYSIVAFMKLTGTWYGEKVGKPESPIELWTLRPDWMKIKADSVNLIGGYEYMVDSTKINYTPEEIVRIKTWHPRSEFYGLGIVSPAQNSIITDMYATKYSKQFFKQGGHLNWYMTSKEEVDDTDFKRLEQQIKTKFSGMEAAFQPPLLDNGLEIKELGGSPDRAVLLPQKTLSRDEVCEAFGVPALMLGLPNETHYNNADAQYTYFWEQTIQPVGREIEDTLNRELLWPMDMEGAFDYSSVAVLQPNIITLAGAAKTLVDGKIMTPNETRASVMSKAFPNLQPLPGGDEFPQAASPFGQFPMEQNKHSDLGLMVKIMEMMKGGEGSGHHGHYPAPAGRGSAKAITKEVIDDIEKDIIYGRFLDAFDKLRTHGLTVEETTVLIQSARKRSPLGDHMDGHGIRTKKINLEFKKAVIAHRDKMLGVSIEALQPVVEASYAGYKDAVMAVVRNNLKKLAFEKRDMVSEAINALDPVTKEMAKKLLKTEKGLLKKVIAEEYKRTKVKDIDQETADRLEAGVGKYLEKMVDQSIGYSSKTVKDRTEKHLTDLLNSDATIDTIQKDFEDLFVGTEREGYTWARTVARTEALKFTETSRFSTLTEMGYNEKEWFHSGHDKPREDHLKADGEVVKMTEKFSTGLMFPGDPEGDAEDVINCGCSFSEHIDAAIEED